MRPTEMSGISRTRISSGRNAGWSRNPNVRGNAYMPFGAGSRGCVGEAFALMSGVYALASIAQRYRLEVVSDQPPALKTMAGYFFKNGLPVEVCNRQG